MTSDELAEKVADAEQAVINVYEHLTNCREARNIVACSCGLPPNKTVEEELDGLRANYQGILNFLDNLKKEKEKEKHERKTATIN